MNKLTLTQVSRLLKSEWLLIALVIASVGLLILSISSFSAKPKGAAWQNKIFAGTTTKQELESGLGLPLKVEEKNQQLSYFYSSINQYRPHEVILSDNVVSLIKEQVIGNEKGRLGDYLQKYGQPEAKLFGEHGVAAPGHFWGSLGLLVFANQFDGTIFDIWYFAPTQLSEFLAAHPNLNQSEKTIDAF